MKKYVRRAAVLFVGIAGLISSAVAKPPAAAQYYPFVGYWKGLAQLNVAGQAPAKLAVKFGCSKVSAGWAVRCEMVAKNNDKMSITESALMGVDAVTGVGHWYSVTSEGETRDHVTQWPEEDTMKAHYKWTQGGKQMVEDISFVFHGTRSIEFRKVTTADGKKTSEFFGKLMH